LRDIRDDSQRERAPGQHAVHGEGRGILVRPTAAQPVAGSQVNEDQADDGGPDEVARAEHVADQARGGQFSGERGHA